MALDSSDLLAHHSLAATSFGQEHGGREDQSKVSTEIRARTGKVACGDLRPRDIFHRCLGQRPLVISADSTVRATRGCILPFLRAVRPRIVRGGYAAVLRRPCMRMSNPRSRRQNCAARRAGGHRPPQRVPRCLTHLASPAALVEARSGPQLPSART